jgi:hypothetical protein
MHNLHVDMPELYIEIYHNTTKGLPQKLRNHWTCNCYNEHFKITTNMPPYHYTSSKKENRTVIHSPHIPPTPTSKHNKLSISSFIHSLYFPYIHIQCTSAGVLLFIDLNKQCLSSGKKRQKFSHSKRLSVAYMERHIYCTQNNVYLLIINFKNRYLFPVLYYIFSLKQTSCHYCIPLWTSTTLPLPISTQVFMCN